MSKLPFKKVLIATGNQDKYREIKTILDSFGVQTVSLSDYDNVIESPEEIGTTFEENALLKAKYYSEAFNLPALSDDSGLCVKALDGAPGIYSARWVAKYGSFEKAIQEIQNKLKEKKANDYFSWFECSLALYGLDKSENNFQIFNGKVEGEVRFPPKGKNNFGYDPIFVPKRYNVSFGEMSSEEKHRISHRAVALAKFVEWLRNFS
jgi:XTP/dITP diphosphohydrolase